MAGNNEVLGGGGLHHVAIRTADLDASVTFYTDVLGMTTIVAFDLDVRHFVHLDAGDGSIVELMQDDQAVQPTAERGVHWHYALRTTRIEEVMAAVAAAGMRITVPVTPVVLNNTAAGPPSEMAVKVAFFIGPSGEVVELFEHDAG